MALYLEPPQPVAPLSLTRVRINSQGYDSSGTYWGIGDRLYHFDDGGRCSDHIRAIDRAAAKAILARRYPGATFLR
jgi:hypothetical protein